jgi:hypothetical protein
MSAEKKEQTPSPVEQLADLQMFEKAELATVSAVRVPGGFIYICGATSTFAPLADLALKECGLELETEN